MLGGTKTTCAIAILLAGCSASDGDLAVRSIPPSPSMAAKPVPARIAEARGHFALGSVALALEGFRKARRDDPASTDAILGIAACYDRMGRFELSRRYYESALAIAPADPALLEAYARSLDFQGRPSDAAEIRQELAARNPIVAPAGQPAAIAIAAVPAQEAAPVQPAEPSEDSAPIVKAPTMVAAAPAPAAAPLLPPAPAVVPIAPARSVTVTLPPARPVADSPVAVAAARPKPATPAEKPSATRNGPWLERLSLAEVALVTSPPKRWRGKVVRQAAASTTVRFVPLRTASNEVEVRLLNAARYQGLAARTRMALNGKGWNRVSIGDARRVRQRSLVLYSTATTAIAKQLAAQFGFAIAKEARPGKITVLLGRDSIGRSVKQS